MTSKSFHIGDLLSVTTGILVSPRHIEGVYAVCDFMTGESNFTHQLPRVSKECAPAILRQHPRLAEIDGQDVSADNWREWLADKGARYGEMLSIEPLSSAEHESIDPLSELAGMIHPDRIVVVKP